MPPNSPSSEYLVILCVLGVMSLIGLPVILIEMFETKRLRKRMQQRHEQRLQDRADMFHNMWRIEAARREQLEQIVAAQSVDHSPVSVPVTYCERRERRRFLPMEDNTNATR